MSVAIRFDNISKQYRLGLVSTRTLSHDLNRWWQMNIRGKEDPYLKIGETNDRATKGESDYVWALRDINLEVEHGEVLGIIGKNGAGKSTLLKILSKVTAPTTGSIKARGRIASLLEVGTGFHQEMTGRENIFMNGAIMGMSKVEIRRKLDEIIDFAGVERYIDTPVKRYSSGMTVRLGFAVAAHLEPDILVIDEVLAVGDAEFQKKAIGKMQDVSHKEGRTVLFVSHNMAAVKSLCTQGIVLKNGLISFNGETEQCVSTYLKGDNNLSNHKIWDGKPEYKNENVELIEIGIRAIGKEFDDIMRIDEPLELIICYRKKNESARIDMTLHLKDEQGSKIFSTSSSVIGNEYDNSPGLHRVTSFFPPDFFNWGTLYFDLYIVENKQRATIIIKDIFSCSLSNKEIPFGEWMGREPGALMPKIPWSQQRVNY